MDKVFSMHLLCGNFHFTPIPMPDIKHLFSEIYKIPVTKLLANLLHISIYYYISLAILLSINYWSLFSGFLILGTIPLAALLSNFHLSIFYDFWSRYFLDYLKNENLSETG